MEELLHAVDVGDICIVKRYLGGGDFKEGFMAKLFTRCLTAQTFQSEIMKAILEAGVNPDDPGERRPIDMKTYQKRNNIRDQAVFVRRASSKYPLLVATELGNVEAVKLFLSHKANVDIVDNISGFTALYIATQQFHMEMIEILLRNGANANKKVINDTSFTYALNNLQSRNVEEREKREDILCMMLNYGGNANALVSYTDYSTVKHVPALILLMNSVVKYETVREMVARTADVDVMDSYRASAMYKATVCGR